MYLKNAQLPNVIERNIQISRTFLSVMGSIVKMNFEKHKYLKFKLEIRWALFFPLGVGWGELFFIFLLSFTWHLNMVQTM
jgi:hypothetical protein